MLKDAKAMLEAGADGIVFGFLNEDRTVDLERTKEMTELVHSYHREAVFHKAFDETDDLDLSIRELISCGIDRVLTGGKAVYPDILKGCEVLHDLYQKYHEQIAILPGGGVRIENIQDVIKISGCGQVHMTSKRQSKGGYLELDEIQLQEMLRKIETL